MSTATLNNNSQDKTSESFLHYLKDGLGGKVDTYCEEKEKNYHDSSYVLCLFCNQIFCTQCSTNHLINNLVTHPFDEIVFIGKKHLDLEFKRDNEKLSDLRNKIIFFSNQKKNECTLNKVNSLKEALDQIQKLSNELFNDIIPNFIKKYNGYIDNLLKSLKEIKLSTLNEENLKIRCQELVNKFKKIETDYTNDEKLKPTKLNSYYRELKNDYEDLQKLNELFNNNANNNKSNVNSTDTNKIYENINSCLTNAINLLKNINIFLKKNQFQNQISDLTI